MPRTTGFSIYLAAIAAIALDWSSARASDEDTQFWFAAGHKFILGDHAKANMEVSTRVREGNDLTFGRAWADLDLSDHFGMSGGMAYYDFGDGHEVRPYQEADLSAGFLSSRTRLEERFIHGSSRAQIRLRERVQASFRLARATMLRGSGEMFYVLRSEYRVGDPQPVHWRAIGELEHHLTAHITGGIGYQLTYAKRHGMGSEVSHFPRIRLSMLL